MAGRDKKENDIKKNKMKIIISLFRFVAKGSFMFF